MNRLNRLPGWQGALDALVRERARLPFEWGTNDCVTFAAEAVIRMTGVPLIPLEVARWCTAKQAFRALQPLGGLAGAVRCTGLQEVGPRFAQRGDVVLLAAPARPGSMRGVLGVCLGERVVAPGLTGLVMTPFGEGDTAWRV